MTSAIRDLVDNDASKEDDELNLENSLDDVSDLSSDGSTEPESGLTNNDRGKCGKTVD